MPVTLVNGSVLLPHPADWIAPVEWQRSWHTGITAAITGAERRQSMWALPREQISWTINALSLEERAQLDERLDAASKSGLACAPYWGRGSTLTADAAQGGNTVHWRKPPGPGNWAITRSSWMRTLTSTWCNWSSRSCH
jgi:hypothetical protein